MSPDIKHADQILLFRTKNWGAQKRLALSFNLFNEMLHVVVGYTGV